MRRRSGLALVAFVQWLRVMEIFDPYVRDELQARLERDPSSLLLYEAPTRRGCFTALAIAVAFGCGFAIGAWWFT